jgi:hypothetical protein
MKIWQLQCAIERKRAKNDIHDITLFLCLFRWDDNNIPRRKENNILK